MDSILTSIKKMLGIAEEYDCFDPDIVMHINSVFMNLTQIGVGPKDGFFISGDSETWDDFLGESTQFEAVKTYIYMKVRLAFDPPQNSIIRDALTSMASEIEWRLNVVAESNGA